MRGLKGRLKHLRPLVGRVASSQFRLSNQLVALCTKASQNPVHSKSGDSYSSSIVKTRKQCSDTFPIRFNKANQELAQLRQELREHIERGVQEAKAYNFKKARKQLDAIIQVMEQLDLRLMQNEDRRLFASALAHRGKLLMIGTYEDMERGKMLFQRALDFDPNNQLAKIQLEDLAAEEAFCKLVYTPGKLFASIKSTFQESMKALGQHNYNKAIELLDSVIHSGETMAMSQHFQPLEKEENELFASAHIHRSKLYPIRRPEAKAEAVKHLKKALEYDPDNITANALLHFHEEDEVSDKFGFGGPSE